MYDEVDFVLEWEESTAGGVLRVCEARPWTNASICCGLDEAKRLGRCARAR
jgi:hypothetical protein